MNIVKKLAIILSVITIAAFGFSVFTQKAVENTVQEAVVYKTITSRITEVIKEGYSSITDEQLEQISSSLQDNEQVNKIANMYIEAVEDTLAENRTKGVEAYLDASAVENQLNSLMNGLVTTVLNQSNTQMNVLQRTIIQSVLSYASQAAQNKITEVCNTYVSGMSAGTIAVIRFYHILTSTTCKIVLGVVSAALLAVICLLSQPKISAVLDYGIIGIGSGLLAAAATLIANNKVTSFTNEKLGRTMMMDMKVFYIYAGCLAVAGILCIVGYKVLSKSNLSVE